MKTLRIIQTELKARKNMNNDFGHFNYRNIEAVLSELKPILDKYNADLELNNDLVYMGDKHFVKVTATYTDEEGTRSANAFAGIDWEKKGMDYSQAVGAAQTYASKYALNSLFLIDDGSADPDAQAPKGMEVQQKQTAPQQQFVPQQSKGNYIDFNEINALGTIDELTNWYNQHVVNLPEGKRKDIALERLGKRKQELMQTQVMPTNNTLAYIND